MRTSWRGSDYDAHQDYSGTITSGGASQLQVAANNDRCYFFFQNQSSGDLWVNWGLPATLSQPSIRVPAGAVLTEEGNFVSTENVYVIGATTGQAFCCKIGPAAQNHT
jgi:hypothetical protein